MSSTPFSTNPGMGSPGNRPQPTRPVTKAGDGVFASAPAAGNLGPAKVDPTKQMNPAAAAAASDAANTAAQQVAKSRKKLILSASVGAVILAAIIALVVWRPWKVEPPRLNDPPEKIAKFVATSDFENLPFARQRTFMEQLDKIEDQVKKAHVDGKLTDEEFAAAKQAAWYGKRLGRMSTFMKEPPGAKRNGYIDKLLEKRAKKKDKEEDEDVVPKTDKGGLSVKRDDSKQDDQISKWPVEVQAQWKEFMQAYKERKDLRKEHESAATPQTLPVKPPTTKKSGK